MASTQVEFTVIIASRNGEDVLPRTLEGYCGAIRPSVSWKLIVADDGSTDSTKEIVQSYSQHLPLELLVLPPAGKSHALNRAIEASEGSYVIFSDDDTIPNMYFLGAWREALATHENYGMFGGSIELLFDSPPPKWILAPSQTLAPVLGARQLPEGPARWEDIYGGNMAVRRGVLEEGFRFHEDMGPGSTKGTRLGEDSEFCRRVAKSGIGCWFAKVPLVQHIVRAEQLTRKAWIARAYQVGRARAYLMLRRGSLQRPQLTLKDRLKLFSPVASERYETLLTYYVWRGFRDECARTQAEL